MDGKFMQEFTLSTVGIQPENHYNAINNQIKNCMLNLTKDVETYLQNHLQKTGMTKETFAETHTLVEWVERSGYDCYLCVKVLKNEDVDSFVPPIPPETRKNLTFYEFIGQIKPDLLLK